MELLNKNDLSRLQMLMRDINYATCIYKGTLDKSTEIIDSKPKECKNTSCRMCVKKISCAWVYRFNVSKNDVSTDCELVKDVLYFNLEDIIRVLQYTITNLQENEKEKEDNNS